MLINDIVRNVKASIETLREQRGARLIDTELVSDIKTYLKDDRRLEDLNEDEQNYLIEYVYYFISFEKEGSKLNAKY